MNLFAWIALLFVCPTPSANSLQEETKKDPALRALLDELDRSKNGLRMPDLEPPYFIEYGLFDGATATVLCELGSATSKGQNRYRNFRAMLRVGSYEIDNSNFVGSNSANGSGNSLPIEDDYLAQRQGIWWTTDRLYKAALEDLARKKAFMENKSIENKPNDFSKEEPVVLLEELGSLNMDREKLESLAAPLSAIFKKYPEIQDSKVEMWMNAWNRYLVNTEGTRFRSSHRWIGISVNVGTQADDGMRFSDGFELRGSEFSELPTMQDLEKKCIAIAERLLAVRKAPKMTESYSGPVLLEASVAASFLAWEFGSRFCGGQRPVGSETATDDFSQKLNKRIFPKTLSVVDDPTKTHFDSQRILAHYKIDDQGVRVQPVHLVEEGRLKTLLLSRNPSKEFSKSNGHGRGFGETSTKPGCLIFQSSETWDEAELKKEFIEAFQDEDLPYGIRIAAMDGENGEMPLLVYKVFPDGKEELVRGLQFGNIDLKAYKRILGFGKKMALSQDSLAGSMVTVIAPAVLFEELDLGKIDKDLAKPPILPNPLFRN